MDERGSFIFMTNLKKQILLTFFICFFWVLNAQSIASYRLPLSNDGAIWVVKDLAIDHQEYLWLIRNGRVYRFDGLSAVDVGNSISGWHPEGPLGIATTSDGRVYIAEQTRLGYIDLSDWTYHVVLEKFYADFPQAQFLWIEAEQDQVILGFETGHLLFVQGRRSEVVADLVPRVSQTTGLFNPPVYGAQSWIIPFQQGYWAEYFPDAAPKMVWHESINFEQGQLFPLSRGGFLIHGGGRGLFEFQNNQLRHLDQFMEHDRLLVAQNQSGQWVQVSPNRVIQFDEASLYRPNDHRLSKTLPDFNRVLYHRDQVLVAHDQGIDVVPLGGVQPKVYQPFPDLENQSTRGIHFFPQGDFFYASYSGAVYVDPTGVPKRFPAYTIVYALLALDEHRLLIGNEGGVLDVFDRRTQTITPFFSGKIGTPKNPEIYLMAMARSDTQPEIIYLGGYDGLWTLNLTTLEVKPLTFEGKRFSQFNRVRAIEIHEGIVTYSSHQGLYSFSSEHGPKKLFPAQGQSMVYDHYWSKDTLWLATQSQGLVAIDHQGRLLASWKSSDGLVSDQVFGVERSGKSMIALTDRGYSVLDGPSIYSGLHGAKGASIEFNHGSHAINPVDNSLYAGGVGGWHILPLPSTYERQNTLDVRLSEWKTSGPTTPLRNEFGLGYQNLSAIHILPENTYNQLRWALGPLDVPRPGMRYRIPGILDDWTPMMDEGNIELTFLSAGTYQLDIAVVGSSVYKTIEVIKVPRLLERPIFWVLLVFLGMSVVLVLLWFRWKVQRDKERLRTAIAADLHDEIGSLLGGIMNQAQLAGMVPQKTPQIMDKIKASSKKGLESLADIVWSIDQQHDHWQGMIEKMQAHGQEVARTQGWVFSFQVLGPVPDGRMPQLIRQNMWMMYKEMLHNTAKHASASRVLCQLQFEQRRRIVWTYSDDGPGFDFDHSFAGNGVKNLKMRAKKMKAQFFYQQEDVRSAYHIIID